MSRKSYWSLGCALTSVISNSSAVHQQGALSELLMSSYAAEMIHGLDRADRPIPSPPQAPLASPLPRRQTRTLCWHLPNPEAAERARRRVERVALEPLDTIKAQTLFGDYIPNVWWPTWSAQHDPEQVQPARQRGVDWAAYREGNRVERTINRLKQWRRVATRYQKREANYLAMVTIAAIVLLWLQ